MLFDRWLGKLLEELLNEGRYVNRLHARKIVQPVVFTPSREPARRLIVGAPGVPVTDVGREELPKTFRGRLRLRQEQPRRPGSDGRQIAGSAQWEDCGPFRTDHWQYVFGNERPRPNLNQGAGLDVSPAVRDYLGLGIKDPCDWKFVEFCEVPPGPWATYGDNNTFVIVRRQSNKQFAAK